MKKYKELKRKFEDYQFECEGRFDKIEKHLGLNTEVSVSKMESVELTELPEKWCLKIVSDEILKFINVWRTKDSRYLDLSNSFGFVYYNRNWTAFKDDECTEITFDQFKKWVFKEDEKCKCHYIQNNENKPDELIQCDLHKTLSIREVQVKVTSQEEANECAEIAKACGEENVKLEGTFKKEEEYVFRFSDNFNDFDLYYECERLTSLSIQEYRERFGKQKEIDWSKPGQFVINKNNAVWRTTGNHNNYFFEGILIRLSDKSDKPNSELFKTKNKIVKEIFKLCTEPITLKNE